MQRASSLLITKKIKNAKKTKHQEYGKYLPEK